MKYYLIVYSYILLFLFACFTVNTLPPIRGNLDRHGMYKEYDAPPLSLIKEAERDASYAIFIKDIKYSWGVITDVNKRMSRNFLALFFMRADEALGKQLKLCVALWYIYCVESR